MLSLALMQSCSPQMMLETFPSYIPEIRQGENKVKRVPRSRSRKKALGKCLDFLVLVLWMIYLPPFIDYSYYF